MIYFYGQKHLFLEIPKLVEAISKGDNVNIMLKAQSGYGKTTLGKSIVGYIQQAVPGIGARYYLPDKEGAIEFDPTVRIHFIDEVHKLKDPELIYDLLDSKKFVFILATNKFGGLEEALENRCISLIFKDYVNTELMDITKHYLTIQVDSDTIETIIESCNHVPREISKICERINIYFKGESPSEDQVKECIRTVFGINDGLNPLHEKYLVFLKRVGLAGLDTIAYGLRLDRDIVKREIEPTLINKGLITITRSGRKYTGSTQKLPDIF